MEFRKNQTAPVKVGRIQRIRNAFARWFQWEYHHYLWNLISGYAHQFFTIKPRDTNTDSFEETARAYNVSDEELKQKATQLWRIALVNLSLCLALVCYGLYLLLEHELPGGIASLGLAIGTLGLAIRYHFWYFQIKNRRLGCGLIEWFNKGILGRK